MKGSAGDVTRFSPEHMSDPSPSLFHDDGLHTLLVAAVKQILIGDSVWPKDS